MKGRRCVTVMKGRIPPAPPQGHVMTVELRGRFYIVRCSCLSGSAARRLSDAMTFPHDEGIAGTWWPERMGA